MFSSATVGYLKLLLKEYPPTTTFQYSILEEMIDIAEEVSRLSKVVAEQSEALAEHGIKKGY